MIHEHGDIVMVEVSKNAVKFEISGSGKNLFYWVTDISEHPDYAIELPPGSYTIVGLSSKLSEDEWRGIVEFDIHPMQDYFLGARDYSFDHENFYLDTATESGLSLLKSKNLSPEKTLILKKQNSKI